LETEDDAFEIALDHFLIILYSINIVVNRLEASLSGEDRRAILEILVATKPGVPEEWKQSIPAVNRKP
jgi:hypothetical protein